MTFEQLQARQRVQARVDEALRRPRRAESGLREAGPASEEERIVAALRAAREAGNPVRCLADYRRVKAEVAGGAA